MPQELQKRVSRGIVITRVLETAIIGLQAFRGLRSHFNFDSALDSALYGVMGVAIAYNTYLYHF